ncbi:MAG TPA: 3-deoxy-8-phosphooctulonate synthase [Blastocatellia bacterium]|nr:3-deoxy-8-phosphooctulonate synthase [Blastocatellia bacterium]
MSEAVREFSVGDVSVGGGNLFLIAGPCVVESEQHAVKMARAIKSITGSLRFPYIFKASYDKANRSSINSFRGQGMAEGLRVLKVIKEEVGLPILTDVHEISQVEVVAEVADVLQIPAFLSRQTDLVLAAAQTGKVVNIKKGQFLAPYDMRNVVEKAASTGNHKIIVTERGASFGYNNLVVDMRSFPIMREFGYPVVYDVTHSLQLPGGRGDSTGGQPQFIEYLARAGVACGVDGVFMEVHDNPAAALSDGPNSLPLERLAPLLSVLQRVHRAVNDKLPLAQTGAS